MVKELKKLYSTGILFEVHKAELAVCGTLSVTKSASGKLRLILHLRYLNQHLRATKFKYEDIRTACDLFYPEDLFLNSTTVGAITTWRF